MKQFQKAQLVQKACAMDARPARLITNQSWSNLDARNGEICIENRCWGKSLLAVCTRGARQGAKEEQKRGEREAKGKRKQKDFRFESITFAAAVLSAVPIDWATTPNDTERQPKVARARTVCRQQRRTAAERLPDGSPRSPERGRFDGNSARRQRLQRAGNNETPDDCKEQTTTKHPTIAKSRQQSTQRLQRANGNETPDGAKETPDGAKETPDDCKDQTSTKQQPLYNHTKR